MARLGQRAAFVTDSVPGLMIFGQVYKNNHSRVLRLNKNKKTKKQKNKKEPQKNKTHTLTWYANRLHSGS